MTFLDSIILGAVQGATEFLPISSSGHLVLGQEVLGAQEPGLVFDIILHVGTLLAVVLYYRKDLLEIVVGCFRFAKELPKRGVRDSLGPELGARVALLVGLATVPTGLIGVGMQGVLEAEDGTSLVTPSMVCLILIANGFVLMSNRWLQHRPVIARDGDFAAWNIDIRRALMIGVAQGIAVLPGISRSGSTITLAMGLGIARAEAAKFSFLLSIPAILGAVVLKLDLSLFQGDTGSATLLVFVAGATVAGVVGFLCIGWLVRLLERAQFHHFAWYCWAVGIAGLIAFQTMP